MEPRAFAPEVAASHKPKQSRQSKRKFAIPDYDYSYWRSHLPEDLVRTLCVDASCVDTERATILGSLDPGSVSFGWGIVAVAPLKETVLEGYMYQQVYSASGDQVWMRVVRSSEKKNIDLGHCDTTFLPFAFRLVEWSFESMVESKVQLTKELATRLAVRGPFAKIISAFERARVTRVIVEQQLGYQNIMTTCLAHVFQALVAWTHPEWDFSFVAPQLTVSLFVAMLDLVPEAYPFDKKKIQDLKVKQEKKYASGLCASLFLTASGALCPSGPLSATWFGVPKDPLPKYDDISDYMWNAIAFWNKHYNVRPKGVKRARRA